MSITSILRVRSVGVAVAAVLSTAGVATVAGVGPASAETCMGASYWSAKAASNSTIFTTSSGSSVDCYNVYAAYTHSSSDYVRAQYKNGSTWTYSSQGWKWVTTSNDGWDKIVNNVVNGVQVRGQNQNNAQYVRFTY